MATIRLRRTGDQELTDLPAVCMRCGAEATRFVHTTFMRSLFLRQRVAVPLCEKHRRYHWWLVDMQGPLGVLRWGLYIGWLTLAFLGWYIGLVSGAGWSGLAVWGLFGGVTLVMLYFQRRYILLEKFTDSYIELSNVAPQFVDAVEREAWEFYRHAAQGDGGLSDARQGGEQRIQPGADDGYQGR